MANPNTINWTHCQDIQIDDVSLKNSFNNFISNGQYIEALRLLETNQDQLKGKAYISDVIMKIINGILFLQNNFNNNVNIFLSDLAQRHKTLINSIVELSPWNEIVQYKFYNFTMYQDEVYMAIGIPNIGVTPDQSSDWLKLGLKGSDGRPGIDINMKTAWSADINYKRRDVVNYGDDLYYALQDNVGIIPNNDPTVWMLFIKVSKGGIHIGMNPPEYTTRNSVWFKTDTDPLINTDMVDGVFQRYDSDATEWDPMYPTTFFKLINGTEIYTDKGIVINADIQPKDWQENASEFTYTITNNKISKARFVEVIYGSEMTTIQFNYYSNLNLIIADNTMTLSLPVRPTVNLPIKILIQ